MPSLKALFWLCAWLPLSLNAATATWEQAGPAGFAAKATLSPTEGAIPAPLTLTLELTYPAGYQPDGSAIRSQLLSHNSLYPPFRLVSEEHPNDSTFIFTLEPLMPGTLPLTFLAIPFHAAGSKQEAPVVISGIFTYKATVPKAIADLDSYRAPLLPLDKAQPILPDGQVRRTWMSTTPQQVEKQAADIEARALPWRGLVALLLAGAAFVAFKFTFKPAQRQLPNVDLSLKAWAAAQALRPRLDGAAPELAESYFGALMDAVRYHIEKKKGLEAASLTSEEFLRDVHAAGAMGSAEAEQLKGFLGVCDAVKFGQYRPTGEEADRAMATAGALLKI